MNKKSKLLLLLIFPFCLLLTGCGNIEKTDVETEIVKDLDQLKNLDAATAEQYISAENIFPNATEAISNSELVEEFISLYFQDFNYKILDIEVKDDKATASLRLNTLDAQKLAKDFASAHLEEAILAAANTANQVPAQETTLDEHFELMNQLMRDNQYEAVETNCTMHLKKSKGSWHIKKNNDLENEIVGGFISCITNPNLLTPTETLTIYFSTMQGMSDTQLINYLGISQLLDTDNTATEAFTSALIQQVQSCFAYEIGSCSQEGYTSNAEVGITTFDYDAILKNYETQIQEYLATPQALYDGEEGRSSKSYQLMLDCIQSNKDTITLDVTVPMVNDGISWVLQDTSVIGNAIFGTLSDALTTAMETIAPAQASTAAQSESSYNSDYDSGYDSSYYDSDYDSSYDSSYDSDYY